MVSNYAYVVVVVFIFVGRSRYTFLLLLYWSSQFAVLCMYVYRYVDVLDIRHGINSSNE